MVNARQVMRSLRDGHWPMLDGAARFASYCRLLGVFVLCLEDLHVKPTQERLHRDVVGCLL